MNTASTFPHYLHQKPWCNSSSQPRPLSPNDIKYPTSDDLTNFRHQVQAKAEGSTLTRKQSTNIVEYNEKKAAKKSLLAQNNSRRLSRLNNNFTNKTTAPSNLVVKSNALVSNSTTSSSTLSYNNNNSNNNKTTRTPFNLSLPNSKEVLSNDVQVILKSMMKDSKLTHYQQRLLDELVKERNGQLPTNLEKSINEIERESTFLKSRRRATTNNKNNNNNNTINESTSNIVPPAAMYYSTKPHIRSLDQIIANGSFDHVEWRPRPTKNRDIEKEKFIEKLTKDDKPQTKPNNNNNNNNNNNEMIQLDQETELKQEILERREFLREMAGLGYEKKYKSQIESEITLRMNQLRKLLGKA